MITGFNTDVEYEGRTFHVQTEDKGRDNPVVESLVYTGGEIVASRRHAYDELAASGRYSEAEVQKLIETQHQTLIREIRNGQLDPEGPKPFGFQIVSNRSLDEVVLDFLASRAVERIRIEVTGGDALEEGTCPVLQARVLTQSSDRPLAGARIAFKLISTHDQPKEIFTGETDTEGRVEATLELPVVAGSAALLCQAELGDSNAEAQYRIRKR